MNSVQRRCFLIATGTVVAKPLAVTARQGAKVYRVGVLLVGTADVPPLLGALVEGLRDLGYVEGRNIVFEHRNADRLERLPELAAELVRLRVDVIVTGSTPLAAIAKRATSTIPIIMIAAIDPVGAGIIANLARPGGNVTGLTSDASAKLFSKNLGLLTEIVPRLSRVGVLRQADYGISGFTELEAAARKLGVTLYVVEVRSLDELDGAFAAMLGERVGAAIVFGSLFYQRRRQVADLALKHRLPAIHALKDYAQAGLLMTYGPNLLDLYRRAASYVAKILSGAKPQELPVEQPTKFELVINLKTAKALGLNIPQPLLLLADETIQ